MLPPELIQKFMSRTIDEFSQQTDTNKRFLRMHELTLNSLKRLTRMNMVHFVIEGILFLLLLLKSC